MFRRRRFLDLIARVADETNLRTAWRAVRRKKGREGLDGISLHAFQANLDAELLNIARALRQRSYQPSAPRRVVLLKGDRRQRVIGVPTVADRVVQHAVLTVLEPYFESGFSPCSYGFRTGHSAQQAVQTVLCSLREGMHWVVEGDLEDCFDNLEWIILRRSLEEKIHDPDLIMLIHRFLRAGALQRQKPAAPALGIPQGAVRSPLFANIYLDRFDKVALRSGLKLVRYGDDIVVCCGSKGEAEAALTLVKRLLAKLDLEVNPRKTAIFHAEKGFRFLGQQLFLEAPEHGETRLASWSPQGESPIPAALPSPDSSKASDDDGAYVATGQNAARAEER